MVSTAVGRLRDGILGYVSCVFSQGDDDDDELEEGFVGSGVSV